MGIAMNKYVVRQPIKTADGDIYGYEILFQTDGEELYNNSTEDALAADTISGFLMQNTDKIFTDKQVFITFTPRLLFRNTPQIFDSRQLVIQIEDNILVNPLANVLIKRYRGQGYSFAINDFQFSPRHFSMMEFVDYIKVKVKYTEDEKERASLENILRMASGFKKKTIGTGIDTEKDYQMAKELGVDLIEGHYMSEVLKRRSGKMDYLQGNFFQLVVEVTKDEPDVEEIETIIARDASLSFALLKLVNSAYFALRRKTSSIRQAIMTLGIGQLKQWIYLLSMKEGDDKESEEVLRLSFLRANFCSRLTAFTKNLPISSAEAYMMGMFSTLEFMVNSPMDEVLNEIPIRDEIKDALLKQEGPCGQLYELVLSYEKANWAKINEFARELEIPANAIAQVYIDCVEEVNGIWTSLTTAWGEDE